MEEKKEIKKEKTKLPKLPLAVKIPLITIICFACAWLILMAMPYIVDSFSNDAPKEEPKKDYSYTISLASIEPETNCIWVNFDITAVNEIIFFATDFSVLVNGIPISAESILTGTQTTVSPNGINTYKITGPSFSTNNSVSVCFKKTQDEIDKPVQFYYKGKLLELGNKQEFK